MRIPSQFKGKKKKKKGKEKGKERKPCNTAGAARAGEAGRGPGTAGRGHKRPHARPAAAEQPRGASPPFDTSVWLGGSPSAQSENVTLRQEETLQAAVRSHLQHGTGRALEKV